MALTNIEYGSVASSQIMNDNFKYLDDKISSVSQSLSANTTTLSGSISSLSATVLANKTSLEENVQQISTQLESNTSDLKICKERIYLKESYNSEQNWYRLYSDSWIEQGGFVSFNYASSKIVPLLKEMADTNASIVVSPDHVRCDNDWDIGIVGGRFTDTKNIELTSGRIDADSGAYWRVCGFAKT